MKTLMISDDAYAKLASIKGKKSFTDLILDITERVKQTNRTEIMRYAGILNDEEAEAMQRSVKRTRKAFNGRI